MLNFVDMWIEFEGVKCDIVADEDEKISENENETIEHWEEKEEHGSESLRDWSAERDLTINNRRHYGGIVWNVEKAHCKWTNAEEMIVALI